MPENHRNTPLTEREIAKLQRLLGQGVSVASCAVRLHCHRNTISKHIRKLEDKGERVVSPNRRPPPTDLTDSQLLKMMEDNPDMTRRELATALGVTKNVVAGRVYRLQGKGAIKRAPENEAKRKVLEQVKTVKPAAKVEPEKKYPKKTWNFAWAKAQGGDRVVRAPEAQLLLRKGRAERRNAIKLSGIVSKLVALRSNQCRFIIGDTTDPESHYCEAEQQTGFSYCPEHKQRCMHAALSRGVYPARG